jgi:DNA-binding NtrC family response regulator
LFGYEKGAFTGAQARKIGLIESAHGGTLFLDEVGDMPLPTQVKLLRVIQEREVRRLGSSLTIRVDFRLVAATHKNLEAEIRAGRFREDLFYRLNVIPCVIPPLRDRREDIEPLVRHFLLKGNRPKGLDSQALTRLMAYDWPGNVRELEAVVERVSLLSKGTVVTEADLPPEIRQATATPLSESHTQPSFILPPAGIQFEEWERQILMQAFKQAHGNMADAARLLGMTYRTYQYRAEKFGLKQGDVSSLS